MPTFVALLRGVNVGKAKRVPMAELRALLSGLGYASVATLLNSGNAVFRAPRGTPAKLSAAIAAAIHTQLEVEVPVIVRSAGELATIISENPIKATEEQHSRLLVAFVQEREALSRLAAIKSLVVPPERFAVGKRAAYLLCAKGILESKAGAALLGKAGQSATTRNWATVLKLQALANEAEGWPASFEGFEEDAHATHRGQVKAPRDPLRGQAKPKAKSASRAGKSRTSAAKSRSRTSAGAKPVLLSGGNPQIAKADGDAPVQAYIAAMPGWKRDLGQRLDALIERTVPDVRKAVKWNSPFYGVEGQGWFLAVHSFTHYVKVAFFRGASLRPAPPGASKVKGTRYLDIRAGDLLDEAQMASWVKQAAALPGFLS